MDTAVDDSARVDYPQAAEDQDLAEKVRRLADQNEHLSLEVNANTVRIGQLEAANDRLSTQVGALRRALRLMGSAGAIMAVSQDMLLPAE